MSLDGALLKGGETLRSGGVTQIVSGSAAVATVITTAQPHGLVNGDTIFFTASAGTNPTALTAVPQQIVTVLSPTTFSVPVDDHTAGASSGAYDYAILSIPATDVGVPATVNVGRKHGLRVGDTVTITASGSTPPCNGAQIVTAVPTETSFVIGAITNVTAPGSTTAAHFSKTTYYSDVFDRYKTCGGGGIVVASVAGTAPLACAMDIQGSIDGSTWYNVTYSLVATPTTWVIAQISITSGVTTTYLLQPNQGWRFLRCKFTSDTNIDISGLSVHLQPC